MLARHGRLVTKDPTAGGWRLADGRGPIQHDGCLVTALRLCPQPAPRPGRPDQLTTMPVWLPLSVVVTASAAVTDQVPMVLRVTFPPKTWVPASATRNV